MSQLTVVFPSRRAGLFLEQALAEVSPTPVWAPRCCTISELFQEASPYTLADNIESVCRIYRAYRQHVADAWPLDKFYGWGEILLSDFNEVDKHLVEPRALFTNIADMRQLDDNSYINAEQERALQHFFAGFSVADSTELKRRFLVLWNAMADIHEQLINDMRADGVLYEGALQRDIIERLQRNEVLIPVERNYAFVGFNVLTAVEKKLFDYLEHRKSALFFWDNDPRLPADHEAVLYVRNNLRSYGSSFTDDRLVAPSTQPEITIAATTTDNAQARYLPMWLAGHLDHKAEQQTAVVLANEQLLQPVLHSIPCGSHHDAPATVNVTMGLPLTDTPVYGFVQALLSLQTDGYDTNRQRFRTSYIAALRRQPYTPVVGEEQLLRRAPLVEYLLEALSALATKLNAKADIMQAEAVFQTYTALMRVADIATRFTELQELSDNSPTLRRIITAVLQSRTIPFHGEPAEGLQVMGLLETRALDFTNIIVLSTGEGFLPRATPDPSFIPYNLREAFGLTTLREKVAVYAHYFYRLLWRSQHVTLVYNDSNTGIRQNEISRFIRQLLAETDIPVNHIRLQADADPASRPEPIVVEKPHGAEAEERLRHALSPTALNTYTECPLKFYYRYVRGLRIDPDPSEGLDAMLFGNVFHRAAELFYKELTKERKLVNAADLDPYLEQGGERLAPFVRQAFRDAYFSQARSADGRIVGMPEEYSGILLIAVDVVRTYLQTLLRNDRRLAPFTIIDIEQPHYAKIDIELPASDGEKPRHVSISTGGIIDRMDMIASTDVDGGRLVRIVDYKTGSQAKRISSLDSLFKDTGQAEHYVFQSILYATIIAKEQNLPVAPCLFFVHRAGGDDYSPHITLGGRTLYDIRDVAADFQQRLTNLVAEILNPDIPFTQTTRDEACAHCDFRRLCGN